MTKDLFPQSTIAVIWDFDKTLTPNYMQTPLFMHFEMDQDKFWEEVKGLEKYFKQRGLELVSSDTLYLNHILTYVRSGIFESLSNDLLLKLGKEIEFYPGLPQFFSTLKGIANNQKYMQHEIQIEHYIVSTGLRKMIQGSVINQYVDYIWACEFVSDVPGPGYLEDEQLYEKALDAISLEWDHNPIIDIGYVLDNTTKTRAIFEINKGTNIIPGITVNSMVESEDRRVPFENMIYIADGPSDIPVFSVVNRFGGKTFAVYNPESKNEFMQVKELNKQNRINSFGPADYEPRSQTHMWIKSEVEEIADRIVDKKEQAMDEKVGKEPKHV